MREVLAALFLLAGAATVLVAAIGLVRLPDTFLRMHAATKAGVFGSGLVLIGAAIGFGETGGWVRVALILLFLFATTPLASHALGRAAYVGGAPLWAGTVADQLEGVLERRVFDLDPAAAAMMRDAEGAARPPGGRPPPPAAAGGGGAP